MEARQREAILQTAMGAQGGRALSLQDFPRIAGIADPLSWALGELKRAVARRDADDAELAMLVGFHWGMDAQWVDPLISLLESDWSHSHEDAAMALGELKDPRAVPALMRAAYWVPRYLEYDEGRSLAVKAIHSLGAIPGPAALTGLEELRYHEDRPLRRRVERVLARRLGRDPDATSS